MFFCDTLGTLTIIDQASIRKDTLVDCGYTDLRVWSHSDLQVGVMNEFLIFFTAKIDGLGGLILGLSQLLQLSI